MGAISKDQTQEFTMEGRPHSYAVLDHMRCRWCLDGFTEGSGSRTHFEPPGQIVQADFARAAGKREISDKGLYLMAFIDFLWECMHQCPSPEFDYRPARLSGFRSVRLQNAVLRDFQAVLLSKGVTHRGI